jgi:DNA polymerase-3 subunit delta'
MDTFHHYSWHEEFLSSLVRHPEYLRSVILFHGCGADAFAQSFAEKYSKTLAYPVLHLGLVKHVDHVRDAIQFSQTGRSVLCLLGADQWSLSVANALLKVLEEPYHGLVWVLSATHIMRVLPTVASRCQKFLLPLPSLKDLSTNHADPKHRAWSRFYLNTDPIRAQEESPHPLWFVLQDTLAKPNIEAVLAFAEQADREKLVLSDIVHWLTAWLSDLFAVVLGGVVHFYPDYAQSIHALCQRSIDLDQCHIVYTKAIELNRHSAVSFNFRLQVEALLLDYRRIFL